MSRSQPPRSPVESNYRSPDAVTVIDDDDEDDERPTKVEDGHVSFAKYPEYAPSATSVVIDEPPTLHTEDTSHPSPIDDASLDLRTVPQAVRAKPSQEHPPGKSRGHRHKGSLHHVNLLDPSSADRPRSRRASASTAPTEQREYDTVDHQADQNQLPFRRRANSHSLSPSARETSPQTSPSKQDWPAEAHHPYARKRGSRSPSGSSASHANSPSYPEVSVTPPWPFPDQIPGPPAGQFPSARQYVPPSIPVVGRRSRRSSIQADNSPTETGPPAADLLTPRVIISRPGSRPTSVSGRISAQPRRGSGTSQPPVSDKPKPHHKRRSSHDSRPPSKVPSISISAGPPAAYSVEGPPPYARGFVNVDNPIIRPSPRMSQGRHAADGRSKDPSPAHKSSASERGEVTYEGESFGYFARSPGTPSLAERLGDRKTYPSSSVGRPSHSSSASPIHPHSPLQSLMGHDPYPPPSEDLWLSPESALNYPEPRRSGRREYLIEDPYRPERRERPVRSGSHAREQVSGPSHPHGSPIERLSGDPGWAGSSRRHSGALEMQRGTETPSLDTEVGHHPSRPDTDRLREIFKIADARLKSKTKDRDDQEYRESHLRGFELIVGNLQRLKLSLGSAWADNASTSQSLRDWSWDLEREIKKLCEEQESQKTRVTRKGREDIERLWHEIRTEAERYDTEIEATQVELMADSEVGGGQSEPHLSQPLAPLSDRRYASPATGSSKSSGIDFMLVDRGPRAHR